MRKKITFVLGSLGRGGAERVTSILANRYIEKNWEVDIILLLDPRVKYELDPSINIIYIGDKTKPRYIQVPIWIKGLRKYIKENRPHTILSFVARINILTYLANIGVTNNLVVSERNDPAKDGRSVWIDLFVNYIYSRVSKIVFQTRQAQSYFNKKIAQNSVIIYNPVDINIKRKEIIESKKIVTVGRLENQKNHIMLIKAFKTIHDKYPDYSLYIYGEGTLRVILENLVKKLKLEDSVFLPGEVEEIHEKMLESEMFVLSSDYEGLSNALLEAMTMGIPSISTDCAGSNEVIESGENGLIVPVNNELKMIEAIIYLIENPEFSKQIGEVAAKTSKKFSSDNVLRKWENVLEDTECQKAMVNQQ